MTGLGRLASVCPWAFVALCLGADPATAQYVRRASAITAGAITFTGNSLGLDGESNDNGQGTRGAIGTFITTDIGLQDIVPAPSKAPVFPPGTTSDWRLNRSAARLRLPAGARILHAELIWGGTPAGKDGNDSVAPFLDDPVTLITPAGTFSVAPDPSTARSIGNVSGRGTCTGCFYVRTANVTTFVASGGAGTYVVGRVPATQGTSDNSNGSAGWTLAVLYELGSLPARSLTLFLGLDKSGGAAAQVSGFCTAPSGPVSARLAITAMEGDARTIGGSVFLAPTNEFTNADRLSGPRNPANSFFSGQITDDQGNLDTAGTFGARNHTPGAPIAGGRQSWDITNVNVSGRIRNGQSSAFLRGATSGDSYVITALALQIDAGGPRLGSAAGAMTVDRATAVLGDLLTYTIVLDNSAGTADAANFVFFDTPPPGTSFVAGSFTVNGAALPAANPASGVPLGVIPAGTKTTVRFQVRVDAIPPGPSPHLRSNRARWTFDFVSCSGGPPEAGSGESNTVVTTVPVADLRIAKTIAGQVVAGAAVTSQIVVTNDGPSGATGAIVTDAGSSPVLANPTWTCTPPTGGACSPASGSGPLSAAIVLPAGSSATLRVTGTLPSGTPSGTLTNTAAVTASAAVPDVNAANNVATASAAITRRADLVLTKSGPATATRGDNVVYTIAVTNRGPSTAENVLVSDPAPAGLMLVSLTGTCTVAPGCALAAGATQTAAATFAVPPDYAGPDPVVNIATVTSTTTDPNTANNTARATSAILTAVADVSVTHTDGVAAVSAGLTTTYVMTVANNGPASADATRVIDTFDPAFFASVQWRCAASGSSTCASTGPQSGNIDTLLTIDPGPANAVVFTIQAQLRPDATGTVENTATVDVAAGLTDPVPGNNSATDEDAVRAVADLSIAAAGPEVIVPGTAAEYVITVANGGPSTARQLTFLNAPEETLVVSGRAGPDLITSLQAPPDTTCVTVTFISSAGDERTAPECTIPELAPGAARTFTVRLAIPEEYPEGLAPGALLTLRNALALGAAVDDDPDTDDRTALSAAPVVPRADVGVSTIGPASIVAGTVATYFIRVSNTGPSAARNVVVENPVPAGLVAAGGDGPCAGGFPCTLPVLASGEDTTTRIDLLVPADYDGAQTYVTTASVRAAVDDGNAANDSQGVATLVVPDQADLRVEFSAPTIVVPGAQMEYAGRVTNLGPGPAFAVRSATVLPGGATFVGGTGPGSPTTCSIPPAGTGNLVFCRTPVLPPGGTLDFRFTVQTAEDLVPGAAITIAASATSPTPDLHSENDRVEAVTRVAVPGEAGLRVEMTDAADPVIAGASVTYTVLVTSRGPAAATSVTLTDTLPAGFTLVSATPSRGSCDGAICRLGTLEPAATATVTIVATPALTGTYVNVATVSAAEPDSVPANNIVSETTTVATADQADLTVEIDGPTLMQPGDSSFYSIVVRNRGPAAAIDVLIPNPLPAGFLFVANAGDCVSAFPCEFETLEPGQSRTIVTTFTVDPALTTPTVAAVTATIASDVTEDPDLASNRSSVPTTVYPRGTADLSVVMGDSPDPVFTGTSLSYFFTVANRGPASAPSVTLTNVLPPGVTVTSAAATIGTCAVDTVLTCTLGEMPPGGLIRIGMLATAPSVVPVPNPMISSASVSSGAADPDPADNQVSHATTVVPPIPPNAADLSIAVAGPAIVRTGGTVSYTLTVVNHGPAAASSVFLDDPSPPGVAFSSAAGDCVTSFPCALGTLAPGQARSVVASFIVPVDYSGSNPIVNTAAVSTSTFDPVPSNNASSVNTFVSAGATGCSAATAAAALSSAAPGAGNLRSPLTTIAGVVPGELANFAAYEPPFAAGALVACGDVTGDGVAELVTAAGAGGAPLIRVWALNGGVVTQLIEFLAYDPAFRGGASIAVADLTGDGIGEIVTGAGQGGGPHVRVWSVGGSTVTEIAGFFAYDPAFPGGVFVAAGDVTGDGVADIVTGAGPGGGPHVRVWSLGGGSLREVAGFFAYDPAFPGGVSVAVGDVTGDGVADLVTGAGRGGGPHVRVWSVAGGSVTEIAGFFAYDPAFPGGAFVAVGDLTGDGVGELVTGAGPGGGPHVRVWSVSAGSVTELTGFFAGDPAFAGGVFVAVGDLTGDGIAELVTGAGRGGAADVRIWSFTGGRVSEFASFIPYDSKFSGGVSVAVGDVTGDGVVDLVTGAGPGGGPHVRLWRVANGRTIEHAGFFAYDPAFAGGVSVASGDVTGDGVAELVTGAGPGGGPHVRVWSLGVGSVSEPAGFFAYDPAFRGGVFVALGDVTGDGVAEIVTGAGPGGGPHVRVWSLGGGRISERAGFFAFATGFAGGVTVAAGDLTGDGVAEIVTGTGAGGGSRVRAWSLRGGRLTMLADFFAYGPAFPGRVSVAVGDVTGDGVAEIVTGAGLGGGPDVRVWSVGASVTQLARFSAFDPRFAGGVFVAVGDVNGDGIGDIVTGPGPGAGPAVRIWRVSGAAGGNVLLRFPPQNRNDFGAANQRVGDRHPDELVSGLTGLGELLLQRPCLLGGHEPVLEPTRRLGFLVALENHDDFLATEGALEDALPLVLVARVRRRLHLLLHRRRLVGREKTVIVAGGSLGRLRHDDDDLGAAEARLSTHDPAEAEPRIRRLVHFLLHRRRSIGGQDAIVRRVLRVCRIRRQHEPQHENRNVRTHRKTPVTGSQIRQIACGAQRSEVGGGIQNSTRRIGELRFPLFQTRIQEANQMKLGAPLLFVCAVAAVSPVAAQQPA